MITNVNKAKTLVKHISCDCKWKFDSTTGNSNQQRNNETCQCKCKNYHKSKKNIVGVHANVFVKMVNILKWYIFQKYYL